MRNIRLFVVTMLFAKIVHSRVFLINTTDKEDAGEGQTVEENENAEDYGESKHSEKEWTSWSRCKKGTQQRERTNPEIGKEFETKLCSKGFPTPQPRVDVGGSEGVWSDS